GLPDESLDHLVCRVSEEHRVGAMLAPQAGELLEIFHLPDELVRVARLGDLREKPYRGAQLKASTLGVHGHQLPVDLDPPFAHPLVEGFLRKEDPVHTHGHLGCVRRARTITGYHAGPASRRRPPLGPTGTSTNVPHR